MRSNSMKATSNSSKFWALRLHFRSKPTHHANQKIQGLVRKGRKVLRKVKRAS